MRRIIKHRTPHEFKNWKTAMRQGHRGPLTYDSLSRDTSMKHLVQQSLLSEQHYVCCYCGISIDLNTSHIEHPKPRGVTRFKARQLDYDNMLASCQHRDSCGHRKDTEYRHIVFPLDDDCETYFHYREDGKIEPASSVSDLPQIPKASNTIEKLGLDERRLINARRLAIQAYLNPDGSFLNNAEILTLIESLNAAHSDSKYHSFSQAVVDVLRDFLS